MSSWNAQLARLFLEQRKALEAFVTRRTGNRQVAADLTQEAFLRLARLPGDERIDNLRAFLFTVAGNLVLDHQRQAARRVLMEGELPDEEPVCTTPDLPERLVAEQEQALLSDAIAALPEQRRRIFLLYHVEGLAYLQIAEREATTARSVEYHLRQALIDCRSFVKARLHPKPYSRTPQP
ncbi:MAG: RNA polymerase sigma factor [Pseudomonas sp.]|uniref:RNA polymerase sigma factor n=1 Tax=Pseudomonas sp. TaxID=306 RepID=UPI003D0BF901